MLTNVTTSGCRTFSRARAVCIFVRIFSRGIFLGKSLSKVVEDLDVVPSLLRIDVEGKCSLGPVVCPWNHYKIVWTCESAMTFDAGDIFTGTFSTPTSNTNSNTNNVGAHFQLASTKTVRPHTTYYVHQVHCNTAGRATKRALPARQTAGVAWPARLSRSST